MTPAQLKSEIDSGPLAAELAALWPAGDDTGIARVLNRRDFRGPVPLNEFSALCLQLNLTGGVLALIEIPIGSDIAPGVPMTLALKGMLHQVITLVQTDYRLQMADVDDPKFGPACDGLIALGVIDSAGKAALLALGESRRGRAEVLWGAPVNESDVSRARREG